MTFGLSFLINRISSSENNLEKIATRNLGELLPIKVRNFRDWRWLLVDKSACKSTNSSNMMVSGYCLPFQDMTKKDKEMIEKYVSESKTETDFQEQQKKEFLELIGKM